MQGDMIAEQNWYEVVQAKECWEPLEAGSGKEWISPPPLPPTMASPKGSKPANILILLKH